MTLQVRTITAGEHRAYVAARASLALQQTPGWGRGFVSARTESVGWFDGRSLIGAGLFRYRGLPRLPMRSVAVFEAGPDIDWTGRRRPRYSLADWLDPLVEHLRDRGVFTARINPPVSARDWWGFDPAAPSSSSELVLHLREPELPDHAATRKRLREAGWRRMVTAPPRFTAEVPLLAESTKATLQVSPSHALLPALTARTGTPDDLPAVHAAVAATHPGISQPSANELSARWRGLASDDLAGVSLWVIEESGRVVYGGLAAQIGRRAWDLSTPLPRPDSDLPVVQLLRQNVMRGSAAAGALALVVPTVKPARRSAVLTPAPGWPPVHLSETIGTWQYPVRATWHGALAPVVDRLVL